MSTDRTLEEARRLENQLVVLRWLLIVLGTAQVALAVRDRAQDPSLVLPVGLAVVAGLVVGNLVVAAMADGARDVGRLRLVGAAAFGLDAAALTGLVWAASDGAADPVWVIGYLLPLEGAARWGLRGALLGAGLFCGGEVVREVDLRDRAPAFTSGWDAIAFRTSMAFIVGAVAGSYSSSLRRAASVAGARARLAEAAVEQAEAAARRERQARSQVAAFHGAILGDADVERLGDALQTATDAIARELACGSLGLGVRADGAGGEVAFEVRGHLGDPGYPQGARLYAASDPVAGAAAAGEPVLAGPDAVAPFVVRGEVVGFLHEHDEATPPGEPRLDLLARLADQLALVLDTARMRADQEATVARLRELDEMKTDFVAITSHELRTPLSGIRGFVDMLRRRGDTLQPEEREEFLDIVMVQTDRLISLVDDLLVVTRVEAGKLTLAPEETELAAFLDQVVRAFGDDASRIDLMVAPDAPARMTVDPKRLAQILTNLLHNALKFSPDDARVTLRWGAPADGTVAFTVSDRGRGIDPDQQRKIFERFHQTERSMAHSEGFGLGLYIAKLLTDAMGGWIDLTSAPEDGATFTVTLPAARLLGAPARHREAAPRG